MLPERPHEEEEPDFEELRHAYEIMGLTLPQSLLGEEHASSSQVISGAAHNNELSGTSIVKGAITVKIRVKLPDGSHEALKLTSESDVGTQVAQFLDDNGMHSDTNAFEKLVNVGNKALEDQAKKNSNNGMPEIVEKKFNPRVIPPGTGGELLHESGEYGGLDSNRCIVRVKLPNGQIIETAVGQSEDAQIVAARIAEEHGLSMGYQNKVWEQLRTAQLQTVQNISSQDPL